MSKVYPELPLLDLDGLYRVPTRFYLLLCLVLRPFLLWIVALLMPQQQLDVMSFLYPYREDFFRAIALSWPALLVIAAISQRVPFDPKKSRGRAKHWWFWIWRHSRTLLTLVLLADLANLYWFELHDQFIRFTPVCLVMLLSWALWWLWRNPIVGMMVQEWPEDKAATAQTTAP